MASNQVYSFINTKTFARGLIILVSIYLGVEFFFISNAGFVRDEFWFAHHIYQYLDHLPYRDFLPYKPVLGYYLLSIPMHFSNALLSPLFYIKYEIVIINAIFILMTGFWALRFFNPKAILFTFLIILSSQSFLIISSDLRVDMLSTWFGLISILFILSNRFTLSGIALAIGFLISQKVLWFFAATNISLAIYWLIANRTRKTCLDILKFNAAILISLSTYIAIWAHYSSLQTVMSSVFYEAYTQSKITWYRQMYYGCWQAILLSGSIFTILWPLTWLSLFISNADETTRKRRILIASYSSAMMLLILTYQQAFPYNMVFCTPAFLLLYADFFSWLLALFNQQSQITSVMTRRQLFFFIAFYCILAMSAFIVFGIFNAYLQIFIIPIGLYLFIYHSQYRQVYQTLILLTLIFTGVIYPLISLGLPFARYFQNGEYQQANIKLANDLLEEGGEYFAGTPIFYQREQAIPGLMNLIGPAVDYLYEPSPELLPVLLPSLYLTPRTPQQILQDLKTKPVKLYISNNRIDGLPKPIHNYLVSQYEHFWGSIYLYAPQVKPAEKSFVIKFNGTYRVESARGNNIMIDKKLALPGKIIKLNKGSHTTKSRLVYRLKYLPNYAKLDLDPTYQAYAMEKLAST